MSEYEDYQGQVICPACNLFTCKCAKPESRAAEEVAKQIMLICNLPTSDDLRNGFLSSTILQSITSALTSYADAVAEDRVKTVHNSSSGQCDICTSVMTMARNEALEEAAKVCEHYGLARQAEEIRALKRANGDDLGT